VSSRVEDGDERHRFDADALEHAGLELPRDLTDLDTERPDHGQGLLAIGAIGGREQHDTGTGTNVAEVSETGLTGLIVDSTVPISAGLSIAGSRGVAFIGGIPVE